ncbi:MAG: uracil-DNA glycosylase [Burkholderiales bacterium]
MNSLGDASVETSWRELVERVVSCRRCPRLVAYREHVARTKRASFRDWDYWGRPVPGFGDVRARLVVVGLAPAAHGGNRTGRIFTGDRSGDWLYRALHRAGFANRPLATSKDDGLLLTDCYITAAVRCAPPENRPSRTEFARCQPYLEEELGLLASAKVVVTLGGVALVSFLRAWRALGHELPSPRPRFRHGAVIDLPPLTLLASYHPSQRNTSTGRLTEPMLDAIFREVRSRLGPTSG